MYHSKHVSFSRRMEQYPSPSQMLLCPTHIHMRTGSGQFCLCGTSRSFSFTAQHFKRLITDTDWQDKMNPFKSAHKQSSRHSGSRKHTQTPNHSPDYFFHIEIKCFNFAFFTHFPLHTFYVDRTKFHILEPMLEYMQYAAEQTSPHICGADHCVMIDSSGREKTNRWDWRWAHCITQVDIAWWK